ncbi:MAG: PIG-L deacetylase family protein [Phycisphaerae bacterium]
MIDLTDMTRLRRVLCLGAHSDDIEIGCGATLLRLLRVNPQVEVRWVVFCACEVRGREAAASAAAYLSGVKYAYHGYAFRDARMDQQRQQVKDVFEELKAFDPDLVFTHRADDAHQDHRLVAQLTQQTFRSNLALAYEIPKFDGDLGRPNVYAPAELPDVETKCRRLHEHFATQRERQWFDDALFRGLMRVRGVECASKSRYAEGFYCTKWVF